MTRDDDPSRKPPTRGAGNASVSKANHRVALESSRRAYRSRWPPSTAVGSAVQLGLPGQELLLVDMLFTLPGQDAALPAPELIPLASHARSAGGGHIWARMEAQRRGKLLLRARGPWARRWRKASRECVSASSPAATRIARSPAAAAADTSAPARIRSSTAAPGGDHDDSLRGDVSSASSPRTLPVSRSVPITPDASAVAAVPEAKHRRPRAPVGTSGLVSPATMSNSGSAPLRDASLDATS